MPSRRSPSQRRKPSREPASDGGLELGFLGAAGTVTGSRFQVSAASTRILVDCGLYQGVKALRRRNWESPPPDPAGLDGVVLTHAHIDHSGYLPALARDGFEGPVWCTAPTADLCEILLPDAGHIQEEDARYANRKQFSRHHPALPLYTEEDARAMLPQLVPVAWDTPREVGDLRFRLLPAGHILGASSAVVEGEGAVVVFSGDLGRRHDLLMHPPRPPVAADAIVMESTYGDRVHPDEDPVEAIAAVLRRTVERGGVLLVPSFAVGRAQTLLLCLHRIFERGMAPRVPVFVNSPMATDATDLYRRHTDAHRLTPEHCAEVCAGARFVRSVEESRRLAARREPCVIVSASGMATGGRVLHHLKALAPERRNTILLPGFQAPGTRGDALARGAERVKIHGSWIPVEAEVVQLDMFSAHADQDGLLEWLASAEEPPGEVLLVHGEPLAADALRLRIQEELGLPVRAVEFQERVRVAARRRAA